VFENGFETPPGGDLEQVLTETHDVANYPKKKNVDTHVLS